MISWKLKLRTSSWYATHYITHTQILNPKQLSYTLSSLKPFMIQDTYTFYPCICRNSNRLANFAASFKQFS